MLHQITIERTCSVSVESPGKARRRESAGAEDGVDGEASFRGPRKALDARKNTTFGKYACVLSGGTWTRDRHSRAGFDIDPC